MEGKFSRLHFRVKCKAKLGQVVALTGNSFSLGHFDKNKVVQLVTTPDSYPIWYTKDAIIVPQNRSIDYSYCLMENGVVAFVEERNKRTTTSGESDKTIEDVFNPGWGTADSEVSMEIGGVDPSLTPTPRRSPRPDADTTHSAMKKEQGGQDAGRLFLVCYHLPVEISRTGDPSKPFTAAWGESLISKSKQDSVAASRETAWIGTVSVPGGIGSDEELAYLKNVLKDMNCTPIFLDEDVARSAYLGYCKQVMWPTFHNVDPLDHIHAAWNMPTSTNRRVSGGAATAQAAMGGKAHVPVGGLQSALAAAAAAQGGDGGAGAGRSFSGDQPSDRKTLDWNHNQGTYGAYETANAAFRDTLLPMLQDEDIVWIHDYHLMLLPGMLRSNMDAHTNVSMIFFLHIPFPTSQLFRTLSSCAQLLHSTLCADVVGFHSFDHARHFLTATRRILGVRAHTRSGGLLSLKVKDRDVIVTMSHVSVEANQVEKAVRDPKTLEMARSIKAKYPDKKIVVSVDVCQRLSGGSLNLAAFEKLLTDYTDSDGRVVLIKKSLMPGSRPQDEATTSADLTKMAKHLNTRFSRDRVSARRESDHMPGAVTSPVAGDADNDFRIGCGSPSKTDSALVNFDITSATDASGVGAGAEGAGVSSCDVVDYEEVKKLSLNERVALWMVADVFLLTAIREGLNLYPLEYICTRKHIGNAGVVVASEFTACSSLLSGSLKVNPFYTLHVADTLHKALCMRSKERTQRLHRDLPFVANHPSAKWTTDILKDLAQLKVTTERAKSKLSLVPAAVPLDTDALLKIYDEAADVGLSTIGKRVIILDYGGTLLFKERFDVYIKQTLSAISGRRPTDKVMDSLQKLCDDPRNVVMVMTGLTKMKLGSVFQGMKNLTLVTSNGMVYSWGENLRMQDEVVYDTERLEGQPGSAAVGVDAASSSAAGGSVHERMLAGGNGEADGSASTIAPTSASRSPGAPFLGEGSGSIAGATDAAGSLHVTPANRELYASVLSDEERRWNCLDFGIDWTAVRDIAVPIITKFTFRTNGTCQSPRIPGIGWSYFGADPEWAEPQAAQLQVELEAALANHDVMVVTQIQGSVEVVPKKLNKGVLVTTLLERVLAKRAGRLPAMCLIMGDDRADDNMFEAGYNVYSQMNSSSGLHSSKLMTVCVGEKETNANLYAQDVKHVENILQALASSHTTSTKEALPQALSATPSFAMISSRSNSDAFFDGFSTQASTRDNSPKGAR